MEPIHRIVFNGEIREGLSPKKVRANAAVRLNVSIEQIDRMFSGKRVVLKNGISKAAAIAYMARLAKLGMIVHVERMPTAEPAAAAQPVPAPAPATATAPALVPPLPAAPPPRRTPSLEDSWLSSSSFANLARTHLNLARAEALLNNSEYTGSVPDMNEAPLWPELNAAPEADEVAAPVAEAVIEPSAASATTNPWPALESSADPEDAAAPVTETPDEPAVSPVAVPKQAAAPVEAVLTLNGTFACTHCGTVHQLQTRIQALPDAG